MVVFVCVYGGIIGVVVRGIGVIVFVVVVVALGVCVVIFVVGVSIVVAIVTLYIGIVAVVVSHMVVYLFLDAVMTSTRVSVKAGDSVEVCCVDVVCGAGVLVLVVGHKIEVLRDNGACRRRSLCR